MMQELPCKYARCWSECDKVAVAEVFNSQDRSTQFLCKRCLIICKANPNGRYLGFVALRGKTVVLEGPIVEAPPGLLPPWEYSEGEYRLYGRTPAQVKDGRFERAKEKRIIICDTCGKSCQGNGTGSFLCSPVDSYGDPIVVDKREAAWKSGRWNATWNCVECAGMLPDHLCQRMVKKVSYCYQHGFGHRPQACWGMVGGAVNMDR